MKKFSILLTTAALPFLLVWMAFILTAGSFNPISGVFQQPGFWFISTIYWILWTCMLPATIDLINESV
jgi:hypothetical protein